MNWKAEIECKQSLKKMKTYEFNIITPELVKEAEKYTRETPLLVKGKLGSYELFKDKDGRIKLVRNLSYVEFALQ